VTILVTILFLFLKLTSILITVVTIF